MSLVVSLPRRKEEKHLGISWLWQIVAVVRTSRVFLFPWPTGYGDANQASNCRVTQHLSTLILVSLSQSLFRPGCHESLQQEHSRSATICLTANRAIRSPKSTKQEMLCSIVALRIRKYCQLGVIIHQCGSLVFCPLLSGSILAKICRRIINNLRYLARLEIQRSVLNVSRTPADDYPCHPRFRLISRRALWEESCSSAATASSSSSTATHAHV